MKKATHLRFVCLVEKEFTASFVSDGEGGGEVRVRRRGGGVAVQEGCSGDAQPLFPIADLKGGSLLSRQSHFLAV